MTTRFGRMWLLLGGLVLFALIVGAAGVLPAGTQSIQQQQPLTLQSTVEATIGYQGHLTDQDDAPLTGTYTMQFELYRASSGGAPVFESGERSVQVNDGLFDVGLNVPQAVFDGSPLWLAIIIDGETLSPRQQIRPAPYAMSLRPGATIERETAGDGLTVRNTATGMAVRGESAHTGLYGESANFAVYGLNEGGPNGAGYGGYFESTTGIGVFGSSTAVPSTTNPYVPGVYGYSERGAGVYGTSEGFLGYGVFGELSGNGVGVRGQAATGYGVLGVSDGDGIYGSGQAHGVYGSNTGPEDGTGYGGYFESSTGIGVFGSTTAVPSTTNSLPAGVYGYSENGAGIYGEAGSNFAWGGYFDGDVRIDGSLVVSDSLFANDKSGYVFDVAMNDDDEALNRGDVVVVTGVLPETVVGEIPVFTVRRASTSESTGVVGIVDQRYVLGEGRDFMEEGPVAPGDYVGVVTLGAFQAVNVDASYGAIHPGDLLMSSPTLGHAMRADNPAVGTVIGKALGALDDGTGTIAVMVTLQ